MRRSSATLVFVGLLFMSFTSQSWHKSDHVAGLSEPLPGLYANEEATQAQRGDGIPVTPDNFVRAESDMYFSGVVKNGGFGKFDHTRDPAPLDKQTVIRLNRDTLYSSAVFDLDAGPVTITLPNPGKRFMSLQIIDEDQYTHAVHYGGGSYSLNKKDIGTRYVVVAVRTLVDPSDPADLRQVHALQHAMKVDQPGGPGAFQIPQ